MRERVPSAELEEAKRRLRLNVTSEQYADLWTLLYEMEAQKTQITELISMNLWSARRLPAIHKPFAYSQIEEISGQKHERM